MSERQPRNSGLSPSPLALGLLIVTIAILMGGSLYFLSNAHSAPTSMQTGALVETAVSTLIPESKATDEPLATETLAETTAPPTRTRNPTRTVPPPPTAYIPGPTAQFTKRPPVDDWLIYNDEKGGYRIMYPPDWYFDNAQQEGTVGGGITLFSYDAKNPLAIPKGTTPPSNFIKVEITVVDTKEFSEPFEPAGSIAEWLARADPLPENTIVEEKPFKVGNQNGYMRINSFPNLWKRNWVSIYVPRESNTMMYISYPQAEAETFEDQVIQTILEHLEFLR